MFAENEQGELVSACIDNTGNWHTLQPANVLPLGYGHSGTPMVPLLGQPLAAESKVNEEQIRQLTLTMLSPVDPGHAYVRQPVGQVRAAASGAFGMQKAGHTLDFSSDKTESASNLEDDSTSEDNTDDSNNPLSTTWRGWLTTTQHMG